MRFDRRFFLVLAASLLWALLVSAMFYRLAASSGGRKTEVRRPVVVATKALPMGATAGRDSLQVRDLPESLFPAGGFSKIDDVVDRPVISPIQPDEPIVEARLAAKGSGLGLAPLIPPGMRAMSVRVNDVVGVSGFILPGMRVDVLVTGRPSGQNDTVTRTVLQNVGVLSAGQTIQTDGKSQSIQVTVVTLLVDPRDAEALTLANSEGKVQLVLRNSSDDKTAATNGRRLHDLYGTVGEYEPPAPPPRAPAARPAPEPSAPRARPAPAQAPAPTSVQPQVVISPKPAEDQIEVIHGKQKTIEVFTRRSGQ